MSSSVLGGWVWSRIGDQCSRVTRKNSAGVTRVLTASGEHGLIDQREFFNKRVAARNVDKYFHLKRGEFAYNRSSMSGYPCGAIKRLERYDEGVLSTLYLCFGLKPNAGITSDYAAQLFDSGLLDTELRPIARVGARAHGLLNVTPADFMEVSFPLPPLPEQKKIAAILSSVDEAIQATQAVIEQTRRVKEGLLQDLLTKGIGPDGRPHTRFKQTEIGEIPESWEVRKLEAAATRGSGHTPSKKHPEYWNGTIRWLSLNDSKKMDAWKVSETAYSISEAGIRNSSAVMLPKGTVALSRDGSRLGKSTILGREMAVSQHFVTWTCGLDLHNRFLYWWLQWNKDHFLRISTGSTIPTIGIGYFKKMVIPFPPLEEQREIAAAIDATDLAIRADQRKTDGMRATKAGLLQDLLTGKVRVSI